MTGRFTTQLQLSQIVLAIILTITAHSVVSGQVMLNEVLPQPATNQGMVPNGLEWIEVYNPTCSPIDLTGYRVACRSNFGTGGCMVFPPGTILPALGHRVLGNGQGVVGASCNTGNWVMQNIDGWIALYDPSGTPIEGIYWTSTASKINNAADADFSPDPCNVGGGSLPSAYDINLLGLMTYIGGNPGAGTIVKRMPDGGSWQQGGSLTPNACNNPAVCPTAVVAGATANPTSICSGGSSTLTATPSGGYTYAWSTGGSAQSISVSPTTTTTYTVTVTGGACPSGSTATVTVTVQSAFNLSGSTTPNTTCSSPGNGAVNLTVTPAGSYTFNWSSGQSSEDITGLNPGSYTVTVTGSAGCTNTASFTIANNPALPAPNATSTTATCNQSNGSASVAPSGGGGAPYTVVWSNGIMTNNNPNLAPGSYSVTVTGSNGCTNTANVTVANNNPAINISGSTTPNTTCSSPGNGAVNLTVTPAGSYTFNWSSGQSSEDISGLNPGSYTVTVTGSAGCTNTASFTITNNAAVPTPNATSTTATCNQSNGSASVAPSGGGGAPYSVVWSNGIMTNNNPNLAPGPYSVTVTGSNGCTNTANVTVANNNPAINISGSTTPNTTCSSPGNGAVNLTVTPAGSYTFNWSSGQSSEDISGLNPGSYTVTVTSSSGCTNTASFTIANNAAVPTPNATSTTATCNQSNGSANVAPSGGGGAPYSVVWSNGIMTNNNPNLAPGPYSVTVTGNNGCTNTANVTVANNNPAINISGSTTPNTTCSSPGNGAVNLTVTPAGSYTFNWSSGQSSEDISGLNPGSYTVTVTGSAGCTNTASFTIANNAAVPTPNATSTTATCNQSNGSASVAPSGGGGAPYSVVWSNGIMTNNNPNLAPGSYSVTVTGSNGCTNTANVTVANNNPAINISGSTTPNTTCSSPGNGAVNLTVTPAGSYTFNWSSGQSSEDISGLNPGSYTVTVTGSAGCTNTASFTIANNAAVPAPNATSTTATCNQSNGSASVAPSGGGGAPYSVVWSNGIMTNNNPNLAPGSYSVTVTGSNGCTNTANVTVANNNPAINISGSTTPNTTCSSPGNGAVNLTVTPAGSYTFNWSSGQSSEDISGLNPGSYTVTVTSSSGCTNTASFTVSNNTNAPTVSGSTTPSSCGLADGSIDLTVNGGVMPYSYAWSNGAMIQDLTSVTSGTYTVTVTGADFCNNTATFTVSNNDISFTIAGVVTPNSACIVPNGAIDITVNPPGAYAYQWSNSLLLEDLTGIAAGSYTVTVTSGITCTASSTFTIVQTPGIVLNCSQLSGASTPGGTDGIGRVNISGGIAPYTVNWNTGVSQSGIPAGNFDITGLSAGAYEITVTDQLGCTQTCGFDIDQPLCALNGALTATSVSCNGICDGSITSSYSGAFGPVSYLWNDGAVSQQHTNLCAGTYSVTFTDGAQCQFIATAAVTEPTPVTVSCSQQNMVSTVGGSDGSSVVTFSGGTGPYWVVWTPGNGQQSNLPPGNFVINNLSAGSYNITVSDANGCSQTCGFLIQQPDCNLAVAHFAVNASCNNACDGSISLNTTGANGLISYSWSDGAGSQNRVGLCPGIYAVTVTDAVGCQSTTEATITEPTALTLSLAITDVLCFGSSTGCIQSATSGGTQPYTYAWNNGSTTPGLCNIGAGAYCVSVADFNGCLIDTCVAVLQPATVLNITCSMQSPSNIGMGDGVASINIGGGTQGYFIAWNGAETGSASNVSSGVFTINNLNGGNYSLTVTDANGCSDVCQFNIQQLGCTYTVGVMGSSQLAHCGDGCITAIYDNTNQSSAGALLEFILHTGNSGAIVGEIKRSDTPSFCFDSAIMSYGTTYYISAVVGNDDGSGHINLSDVCTAVSNGTPVVWHEIPVASIQPPDSLSCIQTSVTLTGTGAGSSASYLWSAGSGGHIIGANMNPEVLVNAAGTYTLIVSSQGCASTTQATVIDISNHPTASISAVPDEIINCIYSNIQLLGSAQGASSASYRWSENGSIVSTQQAILVDHPGLYILQVMDDLTGCTAIDSIVVSEDNNYPPLSAPTPAQLNCELTSTVLQGSSPVGGQILLKWATISANDTTYLGSGSTLSISVPGNYYLIGFDPINGCYNAIPVTVTQNILTPSVDAGPDDVITCDDVSIILNGSANGQGAVLSYTWTAPAFPNAVILQANTPTPYYLFSRHLCAYRSKSVQFLFECRFHESDANEPVGRQPACRKPQLQRG
jgi:hypothetical protein